MVDEIVDFVEASSSSGPLVLSLDDLHWADPSTLLAVRALSRRTGQLPVILVLALRPTPRTPELAAVTDGLLAAGAVHLHLDPLDGSAVTELVARTLGAPPGAKLRQEAARGGGNPLWTRELVDALWSAGLIDIAGGQAEVGGDAELPPSLRLAVLRRLSFLSDEALRLLHVAALLGPTFELRDLSLCLQRPAVDMLDVLDEAMRAGILGEAHDHLTFRHDLLWEVIYQDLPPPVRKGLHLEMGQALAGAGRPASQVAAHLSRGASRGDAQAVQWLQRAAREAAPGSPGVAAGLLEQALALLDGSDRRSDQIGAELVAALVRCGRPTQAEALGRDILDRESDTEIAGSVRWGLAEALQMQGRFPEALAQVEEATGATGLSEGRRARLLADAALWRYYTGDPSAARTAAEQAITAGELSGDDIAVCLGLSALSRVAVDELDLSQGITLARRAVALAQTSPSGRSTDFIHPSFDLGGALVIADQLTEAEEVLRRGRRHREGLGSTWDRPLFTNALAHVQLYRGDWDDAVAEATTVLHMMDEGAAQGSGLWTHSLLGYVAVHRGDITGAEEIRRAAEERAGGRPMSMGCDLLLWCQALAHEARGRLEDAADLLDVAWELPLPFKAVTWPRMAADTVRLAMATGRTQRAQAVVAAMDRLAARAGVALYEGVALRCRGLHERDDVTLGAAVGVLSRSERPMELAAAREDAGRELGRAGRMPEALPLLEEALATYERVGAAWDAARTDAVLRDLGVRRSRRRLRTQAKSGWESLTSTEHRVVALAAEGLTNAEIGTRLYISHRTVETHLSHLYRKLGIRSRAELAAAAHRAPT